MTEIEQLRKEINELRERVVWLERRPPGEMRFGSGWTHPRPVYLDEQKIPASDFPPGTIIAGG